MSENHQPRLFDDPQEWNTPLQDKTYRAIRHIKVRTEQAANHDNVHHPIQKIKQIHRVLAPLHQELGQQPLQILELFAGRGNLTREYERYGTVAAFDQKYLKTGDSFLVFHRLIAEKKKYQVVDLDPYGFPNRMMPDIFQLMDDGVFFITMPNPNVNILNKISAQHLECYYGYQNPTIEQIQERFRLNALCHWREAIHLETTNLGRLWRIALRVRRVKATEYTGIKNH